MEADTRAEALRFEAMKDASRAADELAASDRLRDRLFRELEAKGQSTQDMVREFTEVFRQTKRETPGDVDDSTRLLRVRLIREEYKETWDELTIVPTLLPQLAKELADLVYVVYGTAIAYGIDLDAVIREVHHSNMTKVDDDGCPVYRNGKVLKGPNYRPPDVEGVLRAQGWTP